MEKRFAEFYEFATFVETNSRTNRCVRIDNYPLRSRKSRYVLGLNVVKSPSAVHLDSRLRRLDSFFPARFETVFLFYITRHSITRITTTGLQTFTAPGARPKASVV